MATGTVVPVNRIVDKTYWDRYADAETAIPEFPDHLNATYSAQDRWLNACHGTRAAALSGGRCFWDGRGVTLLRRSKVK